MKRILLLALAATALYAAFSLTRRRSAIAPIQPQIDEWESEGGAAPRNGSNDDPVYRKVPV